MSKIGKKPISLPEKVKVNVNQRLVTVEGPKGKLDFNLPTGITVDVKKDSVLVRRSGGSKQQKILHGLSRSMLNNMITGVSRGFSKHLEIKGIGYRAQLKGKILNLQLGFSHPVEFKIAKGVTIELPTPTEIVVKGIDKQLVGEVAAEIRDYYRPEPYKGKGIRYKGEFVRRKAGKAVTTTQA
jgi:large subunit ribosomal protein L6